MYYSALLELLHQCPKCTCTCSNVFRQLGTCIIVAQRCTTCTFTRTWHSQPIERNKPLGNLFLSASMLFSGVSPAKFIRALEFFSCISFDERTFYRYQRYYLQPAVSAVWERQQTTLIKDVKTRGQPLTLGGDGRADSPGHSAKYGSYSVLDFESGKVLDIWLIQVRVHGHELYC